MNKIKIKIKYLLLCICLLVWITGCSYKPFGDNYSIQYSNENEIFRIPTYIFARDKDYNEISDIEFIPHNMEYKYSDWKISTVDNNGNVTISYNVDMQVDIEYKLKSAPKDCTIVTNYINQRTYFDYYTGQILKENYIPNNDKTIVMANGIEEAKEEMKYNVINIDGKDYKIGIMTKMNIFESKDVVDLGKEGEYYHFSYPKINRKEFV